jgi:uncharacterized damage-inducible protein DinB
LLRSSRRSGIKRKRLRPKPWTLWLNSAKKLARLRDASRKLTPEELPRPIDGYAGTVNGHELLHQVLSHTAHHLRQLYAMLRMIGVEPADPLGEGDFTGIRMPQDLW